MKAVIVGGGIIGLCVAYYLQESGWQVTVLERNELTDSCSFGNAGMIVPSHFTPLASPGILAQGFRWMFDKKSPFYVKFTPNLPLIKWAWLFIQHANSRNVDKGAPHLLDLSLLSYHLYEELAKKPGFDFALEKKGILMYFKTEKTAEEETQLAQKARSMGLNAECLSREQVQVLEPEVRIEALGAIHYHCDAHLYPNALMEQMVSAIKANGGEIRTNSPVTGMQVENGKIKKLNTPGGNVEGDLYIVAAGSWLSELSGMAGLQIPLMPGKGYSLTKKNPSVKLNFPAILCEARVAITPMKGIMRYGGTMEIAAINNQINMNRIQGIFESIPGYITGLHMDKPEKKDIWFGFRPCSPDGLPYIGFSKKIKNMMLAGGHSMMGLGLGPATGKIVADLANSRHPDIEVDAFDPERFS